MNAPRTARERARAELTREIVETARRQLAEVGGAGLSLRAVARELGMVSSAIYRYFPSRDDLLTRLIVDAYDAIGAAAEAADPGPGATATDRFVAVASGARQWALAHPHEYALIYGSPVPGYRAPTDTIGPATRVARRLAELLPGDGERAGGPPPPPPPGALHATTLALRTDVAPGTLARGLMAWELIYGTIGFEVFGHLHNVVDDYDAFFAHTMREMAGFVGVATDGRTEGAP